jgi:hypothetical protein
LDISRSVSGYNVTAVAGGRGIVKDRTPPGFYPPLAGKGEERAVSKSENNLGPNEVNVAIESIEPSQNTRSNVAIVKRTMKRRDGLFVRRDLGFEGLAIDLVLDEGGHETMLTEDAGFGKHPVELAVVEDRSGLEVAVGDAVRDDHEAGIRRAVRLEHGRNL